MDTEGITINGITYSDDMETALAADCNIPSFDLIRGVRYIGRYAFADCKNLKVVHVPETVIRIEDFAFLNCTSIQELQLPYYMEYISPLAFTNSDPAERFHLVIPKISFPRESYQLYAYLLPYYISWLDHDDYGVPLSELEEREDWDYIFGLPTIIDEHEIYRMTILNDLKGKYIVASYSKIDVAFTDSDEKEITKAIQKLALENATSLQAEDLVDIGDYPIIDSIDKSFAAILEKKVSDSYEFGWTRHRPITCMEDSLRESLLWGYILPFIWSVPDNPELYGKELFLYCTTSYGDLVGHFENDHLKGDFQKIKEWHDTILVKDHIKILSSYLAYYNKQGYEITIPLLRKAFLSCMKIMFHIGFSYGMKYRKEQQITRFEM